MINEANTIQLKKERILKWATSAVRPAQLEACLISHLITPPNVTR